MAIDYFSLFFAFDLELEPTFFPLFTLDDFPRKVEMAVWCEEKNLS